MKFASYCHTNQNKKDSIFSVEISKQVPKKLLGDPLRLKQILINLSNNSIKFTESGSIRIKVDSG